MDVSFRSGQLSTATINVPGKAKHSYTTNVNSTLNYSNSSNILVDKNYGMLQARNMKVNFRGVPALPPPDGVVSLSHKISGLMDLAGSNDIILISNGFKDGMNQLEKHVVTFTSVIKRIFFVHDPDVKQPAAFFKKGGVKMFANIGEKDTLVKDEAKDVASFVKPGESVYVMPQDRVFSGKDGIKLDTDTSMIPIAMKKKYGTILDFSKFTEKPIQDANKKLLHELNYDPNAPQEGAKKLMFKDVGGQDGVIQELKELIVIPIKHPELRGSKNMNNNAILYGPAGTGKSLLGEATGNEAGVEYVYKKGAEFDSPHVGETEQNMRDFFDDLREKQPVVVVMDEFDAMAKKRGGQDVYGDKALDTFLGLMSESEKRGDKIHFIAISNNDKAFDGAITRSGRFSKQIYVGLPDLSGTKQIVGIHTKGEPIAEDVDKDKLSKKLHNIGATGADIAAMIEDAERFAKRREKIYEKIEANTYKPEDMKNLKIKNEDIDNSFKALKIKKEKEKVDQKSPADELQQQIDEYKTLNKERREELESIKKQQANKNNAPRPQIGYGADRYKDTKEDKKD